MIKIYINSAKSAGFCFGVRRAVSEAEKLAKLGKTINTYGELIHNPHEVDRLKALGLIPENDIEKFTGDSVIIRTHGARKDIIEKIKESFDVVDLTCPYVKKIHHIAAGNAENNIKTVIIGNKDHPEVIGICGWCGENYAVIGDEHDIEKHIFPEDKLSVVAQTTLDEKTFNTLTEKILEINPNAVINNTVCSATKARQEECAELAKQSDAMIIIGGKSSSNTKKLYELAKSICTKTVWIESADEIEPEFFKNSENIGITAGASTPDHIIKEVFITMENIKSQSNLEFEKMLDESMKTLNTGDTVTGVVVDVKPTEIILELNGCKYNGVIDLANLTDDPNLTPSDIVKVGDEIEAFVIQVDDVNGQVRLSKKKLEIEKNWLRAQELFEKGEVLSGTVCEILPKGVNVMCEGIKMFVPASQAAEKYIADLSVLKDQTFPLKIIEVGSGRGRRIIASIKTVLKEESQKKKDEFWADAEIGKEYKGIVKSVTPFGAFVDIGGIDGLVHVTELSWKKVNHPSQVVKEGDELDVYIKALDKEKGKISLSCKKEEDNPWTKFVAKYTIGDIANGTVVRLVPFGAFIDIDGVDCLLHISEISWRRINHPSEVLSEGQVVEVNIKEIDEENQKVALGYKRIEDNPWEIFKSKYHVGDIIDCKVVRIAAFGAFAEIIEGVDGLIHISQISNQHIDTVASALQPGMDVKAKIIEIKEDEGKVSLSIKEALADEAAEEVPAEEAPVEEAPAEEAPTEETPVEETPVEEAPVEEAPAEEAPVEEAPAEEAPVEE